MSSGGAEELRVQRVVLGFVLGGGGSRPEVLDATSRRRRGSGGLAGGGEHGGDPGGPVFHLLGGAPADQVEVLLADAVLGGQPVAAGLGTGAAQVGSESLGPFGEPLR